MHVPETSLGWTDTSVLWTSLPTPIHPVYQGINLIVVRDRETTLRFRDRYTWNPAQAGAQRASEVVGRVREGHCVQVKELGCLVHYSKGRRYDVHCPKPNITTTLG